MLLWQVVNRNIYSVLAIAESASDTYHHFLGMWQVVSGPIALEIGMNSGQSL